MFIDIQHTAPTVFAGSDFTLTEGEQALFNGSFTEGDGAVDLADVAWDFHYNGADFFPEETGTLTPTFDYDASGTYTVALQVTDENGTTGISTLQVTINNVAPTVTLTVDRTEIDVGESLTFQASATDPGGEDDIIGYFWDYNYDGTTLNPSLADGTDFTRAVLAPGTYTVAVEVLDANGDSTIETVTITVNDVPGLVVDAGPDQFLSQGESTRFHGGFLDLASEENEDGVTIPATIDLANATWDFGEGDTAEGTLRPTKIFTEIGTFPVTLTITDSLGNTRSSTLYVSVVNVPPSVDLGDDQVIDQGMEAHFNLSVSDPGGDDAIESIQWDFDFDGFGFNPDAEADGLREFTLRFDVAGEYTIAVEVTDVDGDTSMAFMTLTVNNLAPTALVTNSGAAVEGSEVTFTIRHATDPGAEDVITYWADFEASGKFEQILEEEIIENDDGSIGFTHVYDDNQLFEEAYEAKIRVMDDGGKFTEYTQSISIYNAAPTATFAAAVPETLEEFNNKDGELGVPFVFNDVFDPSRADSEAGFAYFYKLDTAATWTESDAPEFFLGEYVCPSKF